jgi:formylglycine-generating enzyme required for sulfatase activity
MQGQVFICYSKKDSEFVDSLVRDLKAAGVRTWRDKDDIPGHIAANTASWRSVVDAALDLCTHMLVIRSPDSIISTEVEAEWSYFFAHKDRCLYYWDLRIDYQSQLSQLSLLLPHEPHNWSVVDLYRPAWLPERVARNKAFELMPGPRSGGCLVQLSDLSSGLRRKVILARDGSPLLEMVEIPAGKFLMGSSDRDPEAGSDEKPQREVYLNAYWIARTPITNRMWQKFLQESSYQPTKDDHDRYYLEHWDGNKPLSGKLDHPVVNVSYISVWAFCDYYGLMLPSEAQWEKAARGVDGRIWPWGDQQPTSKLCNFSGSGIGTTTPVGKYPQGISPFGLVDCAGNVWEWCADEYSSNLLQELDPNSGRVIRLCKNHVNSFLALRGGGFGYFAEVVRCAYRSYLTAVYCDYGFGFRPSQDVGS